MKKIPRTKTDVSLFLSILSFCVFSLVDSSAVSQYSSTSERQSSNVIEINLLDPRLPETEYYLDTLTTAESDRETSSSVLNLVGAM